VKNNFFFLLAAMTATSTRWGAALALFYLVAMHLKVLSHGETTYASSTPPSTPHDPCAAGFYCPLGASGPRPCSHSPLQYCPPGSEHPQPTALGHYATVPLFEAGGGYSGHAACPRGSYCVDGVRYPCPSGRYGHAEASTDPLCTGVCAAGWYCPPGSARAMQLTCGDRSVFCPAGSGAPTQVAPGYYSVGYTNGSSGSTLNVTAAVTAAGESSYVPTYRGTQMTAQELCPPGTYCSLGVLYPCPPGRYGAAAGVSSAAGCAPCAEGHYCPAGSAVATATRCGGPNDVFCPLGAGEPMPVHAGYYTVGGGSDGTTRSAEKKCEPGSYCVHGVRVLCPAGRWGNQFGHTDAACGGTCAAGYYCPEGSTSPQETQCGDPNRYCPPGATQPTAVGAGNYSVGGTTESTRTGQAVAPAGFYAVDGLLYRCRAGRYGATAGLASPDCTAPCAVPGFYCPPGSTAPTMRACGSDATICPAGTGAPVAVHAGCYTADYLQQPCPPGTWRNTTDYGVDPTRTALSAVATAVVPPCQPCPPGTYKVGAGDALASCLPCPAGAVPSATAALCVCTTVIAHATVDDDIVVGGSGDPVLGFAALERVLGAPFIASGTPPPPTSAGAVLVFNTTSGQCVRLPRAVAVHVADGPYVFANTSLTRYRETPCEPGFYCVAGQRVGCPPGRYTGGFRETNPWCAGPCHAGYYCPFAATSPFGLPCGTPSVICPTGSGAPLVVPPGFYSNEDALPTVRSSMARCPPGDFCPGDGRRHPCPAGRYAASAGTVVDTCEGPCAPGFYCPAGSSSAQQAPCGGTGVYCPTGSAAPVPVHPGFYSVHTGPDALARRSLDPTNTTCSAEIPCDPGYFCTGDGLKVPCPPGTYNWRVGLATPTCPLCAPGYYCPSYLTPQPVAIAPAFTQWPQAPHTIANPYPCGSVAYFCPAGSPYPRLSPAGQYTDGGNGTAREDSKACPAGYYCVNGVKVPCPRGRYGAVTGLQTDFCTAPCPAGSYCPTGTSAPVPCTQNLYSVEGAWKCMQCPGAGARADPMPCHHDKGCCFKFHV